MIKPPRKQPQLPAEELPFSSAQALLVQAVASGTANADQQKRALKWIIDDACALGKWPYRESERETNVLLGRNFVGHRILAAVNANISKLKMIEEKANG